MKKSIAKVIVILVFAAPAFAGSLSVTASAADYEAGWGKGLDSIEVDARAFLKQVTDQICSPGDSDYEKVRKLNQYVCDKAAYDYSNVSAGLADLVNQGKAVCSGYAGALAYMLDCADVKNLTVTDFVYEPDDSKVLHIWNVVYIDGQWLHVDPTWNDATRDSEHPDGKYFLITGEKISVGRQKLPMSTAKEYNHYYDLLKTVRMSFKAADAKGPPQPGQKTSSVPAKMDAFALEDGRIFVPVRKMVYALGGYVREEDSGRITIILGTKTLVMTIGSDRGNIDGKEFIFDVMPQMIGGEAMMPVRIVLEKLGAVVQYDNDTSEVTILYDPYKGA